MSESRWPPIDGTRLEAVIAGTLCLMSCYVQHPVPALRRARGRQSRPDVGNRDAVPGTAHDLPAARRALGQAFKMTRVRAPTTAKQRSMAAPFTESRDLITALADRDPETLVGPLLWLMTRLARGRCERACAMRHRACAGRTSDRAGGTSEGGYATAPRRRCARDRASQVTTFLRDRGWNARRLLRGSAKSAASSALVGGVASYACSRRPPPNAQFSHCVSLNTTITCSASSPGLCASAATMSATTLRLTFTLRPTDHRISISTKSSAARRRRDPDSVGRTESRRRQFQHALEAVRFRHAGRDQRAMHAVENRVLEGGRSSARAA